MNSLSVGLIRAIGLADVSGMTAAQRKHTAETERGARNGFNERTVHKSVIHRKWGRAEALGNAVSMSSTLGGPHTDKIQILPFQILCCASSVSCYDIAHKFEFETKRLKGSNNKIVLRVRADDMDYESAVLPQQAYVQYDPLHLEGR